MKRILALLLALLMPMGLLVACGAEPVTYDQIIAKYTEVLTAAKDGTAAKDMERTGKDALGEEIVNAIYDTVADCASPAEMGYAIKDIDKNGTDELVLLSRDSTAYALFTTAKKGARLLFYFGGKGGIDQNGTILSVKYDSATKTGRSVYKTLIGGELIGTELIEVQGEENTYYTVEDGKRLSITQTEAEQLYDLLFVSSTSALSSVYSRMTREAGLRFVSAFEKETAATAPLADFSSYDAVLATYKAIVEATDGTNSSKWFARELDALFTYQNNTAYEYADRLMLATLLCRMDATGNGNKAFGYAKKDLNGDDKEELILLNEAHDIVAVFTLHGEAPALVYAANGWSNCLISGDGRLHIERYSLYQEAIDAEICSIAGGKLQIDAFCGIMSDDWVTTYYKKENGTRVIITALEAAAIVMPYETIPADQSEHYYKKLTLALPYTPLYADTAPDNSLQATWKSGAQLTDNALNISALTDTTLTFTVTGRDEKTEDYALLLSATATKDGARYYFENNAAKGWLEPGAASIWLMVERSESDTLPTALYLFDEIIADQ